MAPFLMVASRSISTLLAREALAHPNVDERDRTVLELDVCIEAWARYLHWLSQVEKVEGISRGVFATFNTVPF
jgi:choline kinase